MTGHFLTCASLLLIALLHQSANAAPVYRCGNSYGQEPCRAGRVVDVDDARSDQARAEALRVASTDQQLANRMERERLSAEARLRPAKASNLGPTATATMLRKPQIVLSRKRKSARPAWASSDEIALESLSPRQKR